MKPVQVPVRLDETTAQRFRLALVYSRQTAQEVLAKAVQDYIEGFMENGAPDKFGKVG